MLRYSVVLVAGIWAATPAAASTWADGLFDELSKDYGSVPRGPMLKHNFRVTNKTNQTVHISQVKVSCGCVTASALNMVLKPGEDTVLQTTMDTTRFTGLKSVTIYVQFSSPKFEEVRLWVQANGRNDFTITPDTLSFGQVKRGTEATATATVTFYGQKGAAITKVQGESNYITPTITEEKRTDFEVVYKLSGKLRSDTPVGKWYTDIWLTTNMATMTKIRVPLTVEIESPLTISPGLVGLGVIRKTDDTQRRVIVRGVKPFKITTIKGTDDSIEVKPATDEAREVHVLTVKLKPTKAGVIDRTLRIVTDLKEDNEIDFKVNAVVGE